MRTLEYIIVAAFLVLAACLSHCAETISAVKTNLPPPFIFSDTAELKTDGPLSHFQLFGKQEQRRTLIKRVDTVVTVTLSNTYMTVYSFDTNAKAWRTNGPLPSAIEPVVMSIVTNDVEIPLQRQ